MRIIGATTICVVTLVNEEKQQSTQDNIHIEQDVEQDENGTFAFQLSRVVCDDYVICCFRVFHAACHRDYLESDLELL